MRNQVLLMLAVSVVTARVPALCQTLNRTPSRVVGQPAIDFRSASPNVVEERALFSPWAVVVDRNTNPPSLYVSDFGNNRVLGWRDAVGFSNGAPADIVIGQVDMVSTLPLGPGTSRVTGLNRPGALAIDASSNLYVVDGGNNRILRFPKPFTVSADLRVPDMVIGQPNFSSGAANNGGISARTVAITAGGTLGRTGLAFDSAGNLWFSDPLNHRVLRYPASTLNTNQPSADVALGQTSLSTVVAPGTGADARLNKAVLRNPSGIAFDSEGRLYVADALARVVMFAGPFFSGKEGVRILGISAPPPAQQILNEYLLAAPEGVAVVGGNRVAVSDPALHRILVYDPPAQWPAETPELPSPPAKEIIGQTGSQSAQPNSGRPEPTAATLSAPLGLHYSGTELYVADTGNNRVLVFPQQSSNASASRVLGQTSFNFNAVNVVVGRELFLFNGFSDVSGQDLSDGGGIAIDNTSNPPRLYIADTYNNRVLGFRDARNIRPGDMADIVIGQNDLDRVLINAPFNNRDNLTDSGLFLPSGLAVDKQGNLYVADSGNGRVLRFPSPFNQNVGPNERRQANLVLGQLTFNQRITDASSRTMAYPFGLAFTGEGDLLVSDAAHNRILFFRKPADADFVNGQAAERVIGQPDFFSIARGTAQNRMNSPRHLAIDTDDRLYAADSGNGRVLVYDRITVVGNDPNPAFILTGLNDPQAVFVSASTGEIWVGNTKGNQAARFPRYDQLAFDSRSNFQIPTNTPLALTQDSFGNLYIAEGINRVAVHYNSLRYTNNANYSIRPLSPGAAAILWKEGNNPDFAAGLTVASAYPLPKELGDVRVLLNDQPVPLYMVSPNQINFYVPNGAPTSGNAEMQVIRASTGQIVAVSSVPFDRVSPALFTINQTGSGQVAALNENNTVNSASNPIARGQIIQLFGTGQGQVPNAPADGVPPDGPMPIQETPLRVVIGTDFVPDSEIQYSGLAPGLVGVWQINVRVPQNVAPSAAVPVAVQLRSVPSTVPDPNSSQRLSTTIAVGP